MRYIDIAVAALVGTSAISGLLAWTPRTGDADSNRLALQSHMRDGLLAFVRQRGIPWILGSSPEEVCAVVSKASNSSVFVFGSDGGTSCGTPPPTGAVVSTLTFHLLNLEVVLGEWSNA